MLERPDSPPALPPNGEEKRRQAEAIRDKRRQEKLIRVVLSDEDRSGMINVDNGIPLSPEEEQHFADLLADPSKRLKAIEAVGDFVNSFIKNDEDKQGYFDQLDQLVGGAEVREKAKESGLDFDLSDRPAIEKSVAPNEKQQNKLIKALLADEGEIQNVLDASDVELLPEERAQAMALLSDPSQQGKAMRIIEQIGSLKKQTEYVAQLELLRAKAEQEKAAPTEPLPAVFRKYPRGKRETKSNPEMDALNRVSQIRIRLEELNREITKDPSNMDAFADRSNLELELLDLTEAEGAETPQAVPLATPGEEFPVQVETKPRRAWTEPEPKIVGRSPRVKRQILDEGPMTQVETKKPEQGLIPPEAGGVPITAGPEPLAVPEPGERGAVFKVTPEKAEEKRAAAEAPITPKPEDAVEPVSVGQRQEELYKLYKQKQIEVEKAEGERIETPVGKSEVAKLREKLRGLVGKVVEGTKVAKEAVSERFTKSKNYLNQRAKDLDAQMGQMGGVERMFRTMGENYNKLSFIQKLGIGTFLGAGAVLTAGASVVAMPYIFTGLLAGQRAYGMASMFLQQEKALQEKRVGESGQAISMKERAMLSAALYTVGMGYAIKEGIEVANELGVVERTREWLGNYFGHHPVAPTAAAPRPAAPEVPAGQERFGDDYGSNYEAMQAAHPEYQSASGAAIPPSAVEAVAPAVEVEMPSVGATAGRGYEWMAKRLWEQLQEKPLDLQTLHNLPPDSDIHKLLAADAATIDKVVHQIAANSERGFFKPDGTSVRIDLGSQMTINAEGNIQLGEVVKAPEGAKVTPVYPQSEAPTSIGPTPKMQPIMDFGSEAPLQSETIISQPVSRVDLTPGQIVTPVEQSVATPEQDNSVLRSGDGSVVTTSDGSPVRLGESIPQPGTNAFGIEVSTTKPHIYLGADGKILAFSGSPVERAKVIAAYLAENPKKIVYASDDTGNFRVPWHLVGGKAEVAGIPMKTWWGGWMKPPGPDDLKTFIK